MLRKGVVVLLKLLRSPPSRLFIGRVDHFQDIVRLWGDGSRRGECAGAGGEERIERGLRGDRKEMGRRWEGDREEIGKRLRGDGRAPGQT